MGIVSRSGLIEGAVSGDHGEFARGGRPFARSRPLIQTRIAAATLSVLALVPSAPSPAAAASNRTSRSVSGGPDRRVLSLALSAASCAAQAVDVKRPSLLTIIDYSLPSTQTRLWVLDLATGRRLHEELVAHGRGTGDDRASRFSNEPGSHQSSLGLFLTGEVYTGSNGYSLRLDGLEPGVNDRARERAIVMHGAPYVSGAVVRAMGRLGRSWGCPALRTGVAREVIDLIKDGSLVFVYYPDDRWQQTSRFLGGCGGVRTAGLGD
jgi:hypothetical protein